MSLLLIVLSFRVGKSVFLEFTEDLDIKFIFTGLATLMAIGPLFYLYTRSLLDKSFQIKKAHLLHFIPTFVGLLFGIWIPDSAFNTFPKVFFLLLFITYYLHYLVYLLISYSQISKGKKEGISSNTYALLRLLFVGLLAIWLVYVLNLFDEFIPYIVGPVLYTLIAYLISFIVIHKGYLDDSTKYKTTPVTDDKLDSTYQQVLHLVVDESQFKDADITLKSLSAKLNISPQVLSMVVNKKSNKNFNAFINHYRVAEAIKMFRQEQFDNYTITAIAYEVGFNSISSFNTAFKKNTGKTPLVFRKELLK
ncbi:helix-turn-helix domain-containing protein [Flammeovirgaceae bacterium SG7u.111]|nr:helix-turn-helix domain-containing protein [Flammeovirgaceae bacterium SG7u.132]WPO37224.1 helix-turn-helix domain-containing protein [Flammeovirgaceae bacterium SG7u.111]